MPTCINCKNRGKKCCRYCGSSARYYKPKEESFVTVDAAVTSVFKSQKEAEERLAQKFNKRKDYNNMNEFKNVMVCIDGKYYKPHFGEIKAIAGDVIYRLDVSMNPAYKIAEGSSNSTLIKDVIFNPPATVVLWVDGTKTVVKTQCGDEFDPEKGLAMAIAKKALGNKGNYFNVFNKYVEAYYEREAEIAELLYPKLPPIDRFTTQDFAKFLNNIFKPKNSTLHGDDK